MEGHKFILDACCGPRYMWVNKQHPNAIYIDIRNKKKGFWSAEKNMGISPDVVMDFRKLEFEDNSFKLVVFDPPHLIGKETNMTLKQTYGVLSPLTWRRDIKLGFDECWRVLQEYGVLIFKWNDSNTSWKEIIKIIGKDPLFHHKSSSSRKQTYWACFMKLPKEYQEQEFLT